MSGANEVKQESLILELGGQKRELRFDLNMFCGLELKYGNIQDALDALKDGSMHAIRAVLWASLLHLEENPDSPKLTEREVGSWIGPKDLVRISDAVSRGLVAAMPTQEEINTNPLS
jgi:hypothetical protein